MKISTALFASVVAICCLSCSVDTGDTFGDSAALADINGTKKDAEQGDADAQYSLGYMYDKGGAVIINGNSVPEDDVEAAKWYRKAAEQGHAKAQNNLGLIYTMGNGVPKDYTEAFKWLRKAAEQGYAKAQINLGDMYLAERDDPKDPTEAVKWYRKAAEQGDTEAQYILGRTYTDWGNHVIPQDYAEAYMWFNLCLRGGPDYVAERYRDELSLKMSQDQIAKGQAMTRKWLEDFEKRNQVRPL